MTKRISKCFILFDRTSVCYYTKHTGDNMGSEGWGNTAPTSNATSRNSMSLKFVTGIYLVQ